MDMFLACSHLNISLNYIEESIVKDALWYWLGFVVTFTQQGKVSKTLFYFFLKQKVNYLSYIFTSPPSEAATDWVRPVTSYYYFNIFSFQCEYTKVAAVNSFSVVLLYINPYKNLKDVRGGERERVISK